MPLGPDRLYINMGSEFGFHFLFLFLVFVQGVFYYKTCRMCADRIKQWCKYRENDVMHQVRCVSFFEEKTNAICTSCHQLNMELQLSLLPYVVVRYQQYRDRKHYIFENQYGTSKYCISFKIRQIHFHVPIFLVGYVLVLIFLLLALSREM